MKILLSKILDFHKIRTACHINCVNYFADLIGHQFPEHDSDKTTDPMQIGYAYHNYATYHPAFNLLPEYQKIFTDMHTLHHCTNPHHIRSYKSVSEIPNVYLMEMICDWFSANFETNKILQNNDCANVSDWFQKNMSDKDWSEPQRKIINRTIEFLSVNKNDDTLYAIWQPVLNNI